MSVLFALALVAHAAVPVDAGAAVKAVQAHYAKVDTVRADFVQTVHNPAMGDDSQAGHVVLARPKRMRWTFTGNEPKEYVTDGQTLWVWSEADKQAIKYPKMADASSDADALLTSLDKLDTLFAPTAASDTPSGHALDMVPQKPDGQVKRLHLDLDKDWTVTRVILTDALDNTTELTFSNVQVNSPVSDATFVFVPPAGAQIVDASKP